MSAAKYVPRAQRPAVPILKRPVSQQPAPPARNPWLEWVDKYRNDPVLFVREVLGMDPYPDQIELLLAYARGDRRIAKRTGHGVGKTTTDAWIICHHACTRFPQKTVCTAPTSKQLFDALYAETVTAFNRLPAMIRNLFEIKSESIHLISAPEESFISFRTSSADKPEALAGVHSAGSVLILVDEASGVPEAIYETAAGSMSGHTAMTILTGNPVRTSGLFFDIFNNLEVKAMWTTFHASCVGHPNVSEDFMAMMAARYGVGSNAYRVRIEGEFPLSESNTVIPFEAIETALNRDVKPLPVMPVWGLDIGITDDPSCLAIRKGNTLVEPTEEFRADGDPMRVVAWIKAKWDNTVISHRPSDINCDSIGLGVGVAYRLMELGLPARAINVSETAAMDEQFMRLRDELWWRGREWFQKRDGNLAGDKKLGAELGRPVYDQSPGGKIKVESKKDTKKRTKTRSPNRADAFLLTLATEAITASGTAGGSASWKTALKREISSLT